jgi:selenocysteine lyase/cysteine desulfurase
MAAGVGTRFALIEGDHPNNAYAWLNLRRKGVEVRLVKLSGEAAVATAETFAPHVDDRTRVMSLPHITFHAGQRHDLVSVGRLCGERGTSLVVDTMQSVGVVPIDVKATEARGDWRCACSIARQARRLASGRPIHRTGCARRPIFDMQSSAVW